MCSCACAGIQLAGTGGLASAWAAQGTCPVQHLPCQSCQQHLFTLPVATVPTHCPCSNTQICLTDSVTDVLAGVPGTAGALNGVALQATFGGIQGIAIAANGDVYVAEYRQDTGGLCSPCKAMDFAIALPLPLPLFMPQLCLCTCT